MKPLLAQTAADDLSQHPFARVFAPIFTTPARLHSTSSFGLSSALRDGTDPLVRCHLPIPGGGR
jgi:hypothetical protein